MPPKRGTKGKRKGYLSSGAHTCSQGAPPLTEITARDIGKNPDVMDDNSPAPTTNLPKPIPEEENLAEEEQAPTEHIAETEIAQDTEKEDGAPTEGIVQEGKSTITRKRFIPHSRPPTTTTTNRMAGESIRQEIKILLHPSSCETSIDTWRN
jgi:hypothetical protein